MSIADRLSSEPATRVLEPQQQQSDAAAPSAGDAGSRGAHQEQPVDVLLQSGEGQPIKHARRHRTAARAAALDERTGTAANLSRELRMPLAMILGFARMLTSQECSSEQVRDIAAQIRSSAKRMAGTLHGFQDGTAHGPDSEVVDLDRTAERPTSAAGLAQRRNA